MNPAADDFIHPKSLSASGLSPRGEITKNTLRGETTNHGSREPADCARGATWKENHANKQKKLFVRLAHHHDVREAELVTLRPRDLAGAAPSHSRVLEGHDETLENGGAVQSVVISEHGYLGVDVG